MEKPLVWLGQTYKELLAMPDDVQDDFGYALEVAQPGGTVSPMAISTTKRHKLRPGDRGKVNDIEYFVGSGNVYEDLGFRDAEERFAKLKLAAQINEIIQKNGWTQKAAATALGTQQPEISNLSRGRLRSITYDRLVDWLLKLGYSVEIKVQQSKRPRVQVAIA